MARDLCTGARYLPGKTRGARGAAKGVSREIKRLCKGKVESLLGKVKVLTREGSSHRCD